MSSWHYSSDASADVAEISWYLFDLNPAAAYRFLDVLEETCALLADYPLIGRSRPELAKELRSYPIGNYLIFYTPASDGIHIARILYGGRDLPPLFSR